jgi:hypothetical protein
MKAHRAVNLRMFARAVKVLFAPSILFSFALNAAGGTGVYLATDFLGVGPSYNALYKFDRQGNELETLAKSRGGSYFSIATHGNLLYVGSTTQGIKKFLLDGTPLGTLHYQTSVVMLWGSRPIRRETFITS